MLKNGAAEDQRRLEQNETFLKSLAKIEAITWLAANDEAPLAATQLVGEMEVLVPMAGLIDKDAEIARLGKEVEKISKELQRLNGKLSNEKFISKAPADVVEKEKAKLSDAQGTFDKLNDQLEKIKAI